MSAVEMIWREDLQGDEKQGSPAATKLKEIWVQGKLKAPGRVSTVVSPLESEEQAQEMI